MLQLVAMGEIEPLHRRLKGLEEFEPPKFVGRMARVEGRRKLVWYAMLVAALFVGAAIGLLII